MQNRAHIYVGTIHVEIQFHHDAWRGAEISFFPQPLLKLLCKTKQYYCLICFTLVIFPIPNSFLSLSERYVFFSNSLSTIPRESPLPWQCWSKLRDFYWLAHPGVRWGTTGFGLRKICRQGKGFCFCKMGDMRLCLVGGKEQGLWEVVI